MLSFSLELWLFPLWLPALQMSKLYLSLWTFHKKPMCIKTSHITTSAGWQALMFFILSSDPALSCSASLWTSNAPDLDPMTSLIVSSLTPSFCLKEERLPFKGKAFHSLMVTSELIPHANAKPTQRSCSRECHINHSLQTRVPFHYKQEIPQIPNVSYVKKVI